ncbi:hypothetical protein BDA99DRAFT_559192 [Phascolomyces articulosus]|uniref:Uncharacterized protein n=1 Tax=Phascolomyces articulosus TaxID=60185 RepID=A0AAD5PF70_9FUNG|nr:hypothetical protein BDA99DRAFT_559192 [Phascolomyces articulosus]
MVSFHSIVCATVVMGILLMTLTSNSVQAQPENAHIFFSCLPGSMGNTPDCCTEVAKQFSEGQLAPHQTLSDAMCVYNGSAEEEVSAGSAFHKCCDPQVE